MSGVREIYYKDLYLYVDVDCYDCGRLCALSNTVERDGRRYCSPCAGEFQRGAAVAEFLTDWPDAAIVRL